MSIKNSVPTPILFLPSSFSANKQATHTCSSSATFSTQHPPTTPPSATALPTTRHQPQVTLHFRMTKKKNISCHEKTSLHNSWLLALGSWLCKRAALPLK